MGAWGVGIFDNDDAGDVRDMFEDQLWDGQDIATATQAVLSQFDTNPHDPDGDQDEDVQAMYLALAALQIEHHALQHDVQQRALELIHKELDGWEEWDPTGLDRRVQVLAELQRQLLDPGVLGSAHQTASPLWRASKLPHIYNVRDGDLIAVPLDERQVMVALVLHVTVPQRLEPQEMLLGFYNTVFPSRDAVDVSILSKGFIDIPNYSLAAAITNGRWTIVAHSAQLLAESQIPELADRGVLYYKDKIVRHLSAEEQTHYPQRTILPDRYLEQILKKRFATPS
ncbi:MAG TPA: DUF4259 domain-containing protein [Chloroflexia bacterium]|nr:DUF4259 domain-containing protein [Chloroflexia bacterium]